MVSWLKLKRLADFDLYSYLLPCKAPIRWSSTAWVFCDRIYFYLQTHISDAYKPAIGRENSDERNANERVCLVDSIQKNPSTMADNERRSCHHACQLLSQERSICCSVGWKMVIPARPHCVQGKHLSLVPRPSPAPVFDRLYCKWSKTGAGEGLGTRLEAPDEKLKITELGPYTFHLHRWRKVFMIGGAPMMVRA